MAKRLNKQMVLGLTIALMIVTTVAMVLVIWRLPQRDPKPVAKEAEQLVQAGKYDEAMKKYQMAARRAKAMNDIKQYSDYMILAGEAALKHGSAINARGCWGDVMLNDPRNVAAQEHILKLLLEFANYGGAEWAILQNEAQKLVDIQPDNPIGLHALGLAQVQQRATDARNAELGEKNLLAAIQAGKQQNADYVDKLAQFYMAAERLDDAEKQYSQLVADAEKRRGERPPVAATGPEGPGATTQAAPDNRGESLAKALLLRGRFYSYVAEKLRVDAARTPAQSAALLARAADAEKKAQTDLERAIAAAPNDNEVLVGLARFWQGKQPTAQAEADRKKELEANRTKARQYYAEAIKAAPESFEAYQGLARAYAIEEQLDKGLQVLRERIDRGYNRKHYLAGVDTVRMLMMREDAFKINMSRLYKLAEEPLSTEDRTKKRQAIVGEMTELYNQTVADTAMGEQQPWALFMKGRLLVIEGNVNGAIAKFEQAEKAFQPAAPAELRQMLANTYLQTRSYGPAAAQLDILVKENPTNTTAWIMLAEARLQMSDPTDPAKAANLTAAGNAIKEALGRDPKNSQALSILARIYRLSGNEEEAKRIENQLLAGITPEQRKLREAILLVAGAGEDAAKLAQAEKMLRELVASDPLNTRAIELLAQILNDRYAKMDATGKAAIAADIDQLVAQVRSAVEKKLADAATATQPAAERERYTEMAKGIQRFAVVMDPRISDEEKINKLEALISSKGGEDYQVAAQLFDVYRRSEKTAEKASQQAGRILAMNLKPDQGGIVEMIFQFAMRTKNWALAEQCINPAVETGLDPAEGHLYRGRLLLTRAGVGDAAEENARRARDELQLALIAFPKHSMAQTWLGFAHLALKQINDANQAFEEARRLDPQNALAAVGMGMVAQSQGNLTALNTILDTCEKLAPENPWVKAQLASRKEQLNPELAIAQREADRKKNPKDTANLAALAALYQRARKTDEALKVYAECHNLEPANVAVAERYSALLTINRDYAAAEKALEKTSQAIDPKDAKLRASVQLLKAALLLNKTRHQQGELPAGERARLDEAFIQATKISDAPEILFNVIKYFQQTGRPDEAITWQKTMIEAIRKAQPQQPEAQKPARITLIDMLLETRDLKRVAEIEKEIKEYRELFPQDPRAFQFEGQLQSVKGDDVKTIEAFTSYIKAAPQDPTGYAFRGQVYLLTNRVEQAIADLREVKRLDPNFANRVPRAMLAQALRQSAQYDAAISELQSIIQDNPYHLQAIEDLLNIYESKDVNRPAATDSLLAARAQADPTSPIWPGLRAQVALSRKQPAEAVRYAQEAAEKSKNAENNLDLNRVDMLLRLYLQTGQFDELLAFVKNKLPAAQQSVPAIQLFLASAHAGKHDTEKAVEQYLAALQGDAASVSAASRMIVEDFKNGRLAIDGAMATVKKRLDAKPDDHLAKLLVIVIQKEKGQDEALLRSCRELADTMKPDSPKNKAILIWLKAQMAMSGDIRSNRPQEARKLYEQILELDPRHVISLNNLAYLLMDNLNDPSAALPYAERAVQVAPNEGSVLDTLGWCQLLLKNYDEAVARLRQASSIQPTLAPIRYHAAEAFYQRAMAEGAKNRDADLETAKSEVRIAFDLISKSGKDEENIIGKVIELGRKLGVTLQPGSPTTAPKP